MRRQSAVEICPVEITLGIIGGKWKPVILWRLSGGEMRYAALKRAIPGITQRMLTQQLRELEADGILRRTADTHQPPRVTYALTDLGQSLQPVLASLSDWGKAQAGRLGLELRLMQPEGGPRVS